MEKRPRKSISIGVFLVVIVLAILLTAGGMALWLSHITKSADQYVENIEQSSLNAVNFVDSRSSKLSAGYTDADGDLVADPPTDPAKLVDPDTLVFSYVASEEPVGFATGMKDLIAYLQKVTGKPVKYVEYSNSEDELKAMRDGTLQVAAFNTGLVPAAVNEAGFVPVCAFGSDKGRGMYTVDIIVAHGSPILEPKDLKGHELTLTQIGSNSGYKVPLVLLKRKFGLLPFRDYMVRYSQSHEASIEGLAKRDYTVAAVASDVLDREVKNGTILPDAYRVIYSSEPFPSAPFGYTHNLSPELAAKVRQAFYKFPFAKSSVEKTFGSETYNKFVPINYRYDFASVRDIDDAIGETVSIADAKHPAAATTMPATQP